ncbi:MAG: hypothetical protein N2202_09155 [Proteobacteria bacterium]|nr:hypothetical protein [Pseudomonadota bacterium]
MIKKQIALSLFILALTFVFNSKSFAISGYLNSFNTTYGTKGTVLDSCNLCHTVKPAVNNYGAAYMNNGYSFKAIENLDSDGDGFTNIAEINARTFPGDPNSKPSNNTDNTPPVVTAFSIPATSNSLTISITTFTATDNVGVTGYLLTETSTTPSATANGWSATAPTTYTFSTAGTKTLYAWAKDAAGNVSTSKSATVTITLNTADTTSPTAPTNLTANSVTTSSVSLSWSASTDNVGVAGYKIFKNYVEIGTTTLTNYTDSNVSPSTTYTYYVQAFDSAGNISQNSNIVQVTTPAVVSGFRILTPNNGEKFLSGSPIPITWEAHPNATYYNISYSTNNGLTWIPLENGIMGTTYNWNTTNFKKNVKCRILVTAYNSNYIQIASDKTDLPFTIEVATINKPSGGEIITNGKTLNITWSSSPVLSTTAKVSIYYKLNNSFIWKLAGTINGNPGSYNWSVPVVTKDTKAVIKVVFRNSLGSVLGVAISNPITITP